MNHHTKDTKLENYIAQIKETVNSECKLANYTKATKRLNQLKKKYNKLCRILESDVENESDEETDIEKIMFELNKINNEIEEEGCDAGELIANYIKYKSLLNNLERESDKIKNEIFKVDRKKDKITIHKLNPDDIL